MGNSPRTVGLMVGLMVAYGGYVFVSLYVASLWFMIDITI